jgi:hypothetical protein
MILYCISPGQAIEQWVAFHILCSCVQPHGPNLPIQPSRHLIATSHGNNALFPRAISLERSKRVVTRQRVRARPLSRIPLQAARDKLTEYPADDDRLSVQDEQSNRNIA